MLVFALALSLLVHLIFALVVRVSRGSTQNEAEVVTIEHRAAIVRLQTPPPRPKVTPVPHPKPSSRSAPRQTRGTQPSSSGGTGVAASAAPTPVPTAVAVASPAACGKSDAGAAVIGDPPQPQLPIAARAEGTNGIVLIKVQLDAQGEVTGAEVSRSAGNPSLDLAAVGMARGARYAPALHACKPIAAEYTFSVKFYAW